MSAAPDSAKPSRTFHFISGLPRSGSTLLAAILKQNPRFHAGMTSPVGDMVSALIGEMSGKNDFSVFITEQQRQAVLRGVFRNHLVRCSARESGHPRPHAAPRAL